VDAYFFDSSALVKRYTREMGSGWVLSLLNLSAGNIVYIASITEVEVVSAIARKVREGIITSADASARVSELHYDFSNQYNVTDVNEAIIIRAIFLVQTYVLRGYDAVQLAAALQFNEHRISVRLPEITFVSSDIALNNAAIAEGLNVDNPSLHP
jgi:uncharacterized protein